MADSFCKVRLDPEKLSQWRYPTDSDCITPPALLPHIQWMQTEYETDQTRVVGCVCYEPLALDGGLVPLKLKGLIYVVRLQTQKWVDQGPMRITEKYLLFDLYIYSNPLFHIYAWMNLVSVEAISAPIKVLELSHSVYMAQFKFNSHSDQNGGSAIFKYFRYCTRVLIPKAVRNCDRSSDGNMVHDSRAVTRDVFDMISLFMPIQIGVISGSTPGTVTIPTTEGYPCMFPVCFASAYQAGKLYIVRFLETFTDNYYDIYFSVCPWTNTICLPHARHVEYKYMAFVKLDADVWPKVGM